MELSGRKLGKSAILPSASILQKKKEPALGAPGIKQSYLANCFVFLLRSAQAANMSAQSHYWCATEEQCCSPTGLGAAWSFQGLKVQLFCAKGGCTATPGLCLLCSCLDSNACLNTSCIWVGAVLQIKVSDTSHWTEGCAPCLSSCWTLPVETAARPHQLCQWRFSLYSLLVAECCC